MVVSDDTISRYWALWENLTDESVEEYRNLATPDVRFRDPLTDSKGIDAVIASFHKFFRDLDEIQFRVKTYAVDGPVVFSHWVMICRIRKLPKRLWEIDAVSKIIFDENGKVIDHIDYWDTSPMIESVPVLGKVVTLIKKFFA